MSKPKSPVKVRRRWKINPKTRVKPSARRYLRTKTRKETRKVIENATKKNT